MVISDASVISAFISSIAALSTAVVYLYKVQDTRYKRTLSKLDDCEVNHDESNKQIIELTKKVSYLKGATDLHNNIVDHIERLRAVK